MTAFSMTGSISRRAASTLTCQRVGGCSAKTLATALAVASLLVASSLIYVWSRTEIVRQGYALSDAAHQIKELKAERERLRIEIVQLSSPERIGAIARDQLGMLVPDVSQVKVVEAGEPVAAGDRLDGVALAQDMGGVKPRQAH